MYICLYREHVFSAWLPIFAISFEFFKLRMIRAVGHRCFDRSLWKALFDNPAPGLKTEVKNKKKMQIELQSLTFGGSQLVSRIFENTRL